MSEPTARERLEAEVFDANDGGERDSFEVVVVAAALAYGETEHQAGMVEATRAICEWCRAAPPYKIIGSLRWWHQDGACVAGPIHDALAARRRGEQGE